MLISLNNKCSGCAVSGCTAAPGCTETGVSGAAIDSCSGLLSKGIYSNLSSDHLLSDHELYNDEEGLYNSLVFIILDGLLAR